VKDRTTRMLERLKSGATYAEVGAESGLTRQRVHQVAKRFGVDAERRERRAMERYSGTNYRPPTRQELAAQKTRLRHAVRSVANGRRPTEAAIRHKVPYLRLLAAMQATGISAPAHRRPGTYSKQQIAAALDLIAKSGLDDDEIAWETGVSYLTVRGLRRRLPFMRRADAGKT
jgi:hypothetical protein